MTLKQRGKFMKRTILDLTGKIEDYKSIGLRALFLYWGQLQRYIYQVNEKARHGLVRIASIFREKCLAQVRCDGE